MGERKMEQFPIIVRVGAYDSTADPTAHGEMTSARKVAFFELELIRGDGGISYLDGKEHCTSRGSLLVAKPGQSRYSRLPHKCLYLHAVIDDPQIRELVLSLPDTFLPQRSEEYEAVFEELLAHSLEKGEELLLHGTFLRLLTMMKNETLLLSTTEHEAAPRNVQCIAGAIAYIEHHLAEHLSLSDVARHVGMSRIYFHNLFLRTVHTTLHKYILSRRIAYAKTLLLLGETSLSEIAFAAGFSSQSYFQAVFKRETGQTPGAFRKEQNRAYHP